MFIVGIDVAKRNHEVSIITSDGQTVHRAFSIRNNCTGYNLMMEKVRKLTNIKCQIVFAMESTAHYWLALYTRLKKDGYIDWHTASIKNCWQTNHPITSKMRMNG